MTLDRMRKFDEFCGMAYQKALRFAKSIVREPEEAADILQEAFVKAYRAYEKTDELPTGPNWLYQIIRRVHIDRIRARNRRVQTVSLQETALTHPGFEPIDPDSDIERTVMAQVPDTEFEELLSSLTPDEERALRLSLREDITDVEMARQMNCSRTSFKRKMAVARRRLVQAVRTSGAVPAPGT
ncbi:MAG: ECF RNA polymerase sigma factor SigM [Fimbriimonadaceae bacterium]|nr:ECF RNA polymerase sigma factor SigM [Fimbriimonadaceae bacterium]